MVAMRRVVYKHGSTSCTLALYFVPIPPFARTCQCPERNQNSLLEGLVFDRDRTRVSNIVQSSSLPRLATEPGGTSTPPTEIQNARLLSTHTRTKPEPKT